jgi:protein-tyrosine-phosphatase
VSWVVTHKRARPQPPTLRSPAGGELIEHSASDERRTGVVFVCTGNSARSILGEALLRDLGGPRFAAYSAGSRPTGRVHPLAIEVLTERGHPTDGLRSKSWEELAVPGSPELDIVITVCDGAAGEACPVWPGRPTTAHWGAPDPAAVVGTRDQQRAAFLDVYALFRTRIERLLALPLGALTAPELAERLREIGATT